MLKKKIAVKDGSVVLPEFFFFSYSDLVPEEPTKTVIVLYSLELASFLFLTLRHEAITQAMASSHSQPKL